MSTLQQIETPRGYRASGVDAAMKPSIQWFGTENSLNHERRQVDLI